MQDLHNQISPVAQFAAQVSDNTEQVASGWVDLQGYDSCEFVFAFGTLADAGAEFTPKIEYSVDGTNDSGDVADADLLPIGTGQEAAAQVIQSGDDSVVRLGYIGGERWVRAALVVTNNASAADVACVALRGHPAVAPTA